MPFVADSAAVMREVARVLRPGGRWVFATTHPLRWVFPDDPGPAGLTARTPYFDRSPYVEVDDAGEPVYVEHHRTLGDRVRELVAAGFRLVDLIEPEWPAGHTREWGQWSPLRGALVPGTAIYVAEKPADRRGAGSPWPGDDPTHGVGPTAGGVMLAVTLLGPVAAAVAGRPVHLTGSG